MRAPRSLPSMPLLRSLATGSRLSSAPVRIRCLQKATAGKKGGMLSVGLGAVAAQEFLDQLDSSDGKAVIACINSPENITVAGDVSAIEEVENMCKQAAVFSRRLRVDTGYHSHHMLPIAGPYLDLLRKHVTPLRDKAALYSGDDFDEDSDIPAVIFSSAVTGDRMTSLCEIAAPEHWVGSLTQPVEASHGSSSPDP
ncbi:hypothetical protein NUW58_g3949 [Xylaria curta]|uniref:Uncharacterized protein n=1 Tax=Xylaria curta TaxID=42375 RepID=A0ACC1P8K5_9PEZI|nr:hypothetical protein NUW58_g3949 [Xylaria curta]